MNFVEERIKLLVNRVNELKSLDASYQAHVNEKIETLADSQNRHTQGCVTQYRNYIQIFIDEAHHFLSQINAVPQDLHGLLHQFCKELVDLHSYMQSLINANTLDISDSVAQYNGLKELESQLKKFIANHPQQPTLLVEANPLLGIVTNLINSPQTAVFLKDRKDLKNLRAVVTLDLVNYRKFRTDMEDELLKLQKEIDQLLAPPPGAEKKSPADSSSATFSTTPLSTVRLWGQFNFNVTNSLNKLEKDFKKFMSQNENKSTSTSTSKMRLSTNI